jgi:pimeloyl-ACP methyl ester carboxylesterase
MLFRDDDLTHLEAHGMPPLPAASRQGFVDSAGARIWYGAYGSGLAVVLLHGGMGNSGNWAYQLPDLLAAGYQVVAVDSRGQGRSTRTEEPFSYRQMAADVRTVLDALDIMRAAIVGWSDGADTGLVMAEETPERVAGLFFFACNVDSGGTKPFVYTPVIGRILEQHKRDYAALSSTPDDFDTVFEAVGLMQRTQPEYAAADLARIDVPVTVALGEHDEFIKREHLQYLAATLPNAGFELLPDVSHFAPLQRPDVFNKAVLRFLGKIHG